MKVIMIHPADNNQLFLMKETCEQLNNIGIHTNRLEYGKFVLSSPRKDRTPWIFLLFSILEKIPKLRWYSRNYYKNNIIKIYSNIIKDYDVLHIQSSFFKEFADITEKAQDLGVKVITTIWGSDLNWETVEERPWKERIYRNSNIIHLGPSSSGEKNVFKQKYPEYAYKIRRVPFGLKQFDILDEMFSGKIAKDVSFISEQAKGRIMITCGYNGREMQQHMLILEAIDKLPKEIKQHLFLFLPMTYLLKDEYYRMVLEKLNSMEIPFQIQRDRLTLEQNLSMRMNTDIVVNIQKTDRLSASLQEHLYCGSVLIAGDWLPYEVYTDNDVFYIKTSLDNLYDNIKDVIENYPAYKQKCTNNRTNLYNISSWKAVLPKWKSFYDEMINL